MHNLFWLLSFYLLILIVISTLGGGIRYKENFLDVVFDESNTEISANDTSEILKTLSPAPVVKSVLKNQIVVEEEESNCNEDGCTIQPPVVPSVESVPSPITDAKSTEVLAFDGEVFAPF